MRRPRDTEELAWVAGLFSADGSTFVAHHASGARLRCSIDSTDLENLERCCSVLGLGRIFGPYSRRGRRRLYRWQVAGAGEVDVALLELWPWLSTRKRAQAREAIAEIVRVRGPALVAARLRRKAGDAA